MSVPSNPINPPNISYNLILDKPELGLTPGVTYLAAIKGASVKHDESPSHQRCCLTLDIEVKNG